MPPLATALFQENKLYTSWDWHKLRTISLTQDELTFAAFVSVLLVERTIDINIVDLHHFGPKFSILYTPVNFGSGINGYSS